MSQEELFAAATKIKAQLSKTNKKVEKLEQRYVKVLKERKGAEGENEKKLKNLMKLVDENEGTIEALEEETRVAYRCLNGVLCDVISTDIFSEENRVTWDKCSKLMQE